MKIYMARHGQTDWNLAKRIQGATDIPLNEKGRQQAAALAEDLRRQGARLCKVYSSRQARALETACIVADAFGVPVEPVAGLEEMGLGLWEGRTWDEVERTFPEQFQQWFDHRRYTPTPEGESYQALLERVFPALEHILAGTDPAGGDVLVLTHGAVMFALLALKQDVPFEDMTNVIRVDNAKAVPWDREELAALKKKL